MNNLTTFYLLRHVETENNVNKIIQGHLDSPLTKNGEEQARALANEFKDVKFDLVFSSDLLRAKRTAEVITLEKNLAVETTKLLRERNWGEFEGTSSGSFDKYYETLSNASDEERRKYKATKNFESDEEIITRMITFLRETAVNFPGKKILVVSHGSIIRMFLIHLGFGTYKTLSPGSLKNGGWIRIESDGIDFFVRETKQLEITS